MANLTSKFKNFQESEGALNLGMVFCLSSLNSTPLDKRGQKNAWIPCKVANFIIPKQHMYVDMQNITTLFA
jgi:hypothetical protein